jgi:uncharacterized membrane protein
VAGEEPDCLYANVLDTMALILLYLNLFQSDFFEEFQTYVMGLYFTVEITLTCVIIIIIIIITFRHTRASEGRGNRKLENIT